MNLQRYRNFFVNMSCLDDSGVTKVSVSGLTPGPRVTDVERVRFRSDYFVIEDNGIKVDLLDKIKRRPVKGEYIYRLGILLCNLVLPGKIRQGFLQSYDTVRGNGDRLRLRIILDEPQFSTLPWEYLYLESAAGVRNVNDFLVLRPDLSIARLAAANTFERSFPEGGKYKLTAALASPKDQDPLDLEADRKALQNAIDSSRPTDEIVPEWAYPATRVSLRDSLREGCDIFHFSGHGFYADPDGQILLQKGDGTSDGLDAGSLSQLLAAAKTKVAVLSACDSGKFSSTNPFGGVATSLAGNGIPAVIASQFRLLDRSALPLIKEVYRSLLEGQEIDDGVYQARQSILLDSGFENRDWGAIVLFLRGENGTVFRREEAALSRRPTPRILPTPLQAPLLGRNEIITDVSQQIIGGKKFHLHGGVGVGKTSLATAIFSALADERRFPDGFIWASANGLNAERLLEYVGSNFPGQTVSKAESKADKINELRRVLAGHPGLLIGLDNVTSEDAARSVLDAAGKASVMLNGEMAFDLSGRAEAVPVSPLNPRLAQELFLAEAKLNREQLPLGDHALVAMICDRLQGLPLGVKIAAGKYREGESLQTVLDRINSAALATEAIQALVTSVLDELRDAPEAQRLLVRLASFPALEAPVRPLQGHPNNNEDLTEFFQAKDKLLALHVIEKAGIDRLALHPLLGPLIVRQTPKAAATQERNRMIDWLIAYARDNRENIPALSLEHRNFIALLDSLKGRKQWKAIASLMQHLFDYLRLRGLWSEALSRLDLCVSHQDDLSDSQRALCFLQRGIINTLLARNDAAGQDLTTARKIYASISDTASVGRVQFRLAVLTIWKGELLSAAGELREAIRNMGETAPHSDRAAAHTELGTVLSVTASAEKAIEEYRNALSVAEQSRDLEQQARAYRAIGRIHDRMGEIQLAEKAYERALELAGKLSDGLQCAAIEQSIGHMLFHGSRYPDAQSRFEIAFGKYTDLGYRPGVASALHALANVSLAQQNYPDAERKYGESLEINEMLGLVLPAAYNCYQLAILHERQQDDKRAEQGYKNALDVAQNRKDQNLEGGALVQLAKFAHNHGNDAAAMDWAKQATVVAERIGDLLTGGLAERALGNLEGAYAALSRFNGEEAKAILGEIETKAKTTEVLPAEKPSEGEGKTFDSRIFDRHLNIDRYLEISPSAMVPGDPKGGWG